MGAGHKVPGVFTPHLKLRQSPEKGGAGDRNGAGASLTDRETGKQDAKSPVILLSGTFTRRKLSFDNGVDTRRAVRNDSITSYIQHRQYGRNPRGRANDGPFIAFRQNLTHTRPSERRSETRRNADEREGNPSLNGPRRDANQQYSRSNDEHRNTRQQPRRPQIFPAAGTTHPPGAEATRS